MATQDYEYPWKPIPRRPEFVADQLITSLVSLNFEQAVFNIQPANRKAPVQKI